MNPAAGPPAVRLRFGARDIELRWSDAQGGLHVHLLPLGLEHLQQLHRFARPPGPLALEAAIESIEDALMPLARTVPREGQLVLETDRVPEGLAEALGQPDFDLAAVESAFGRLSALALGRPATQAGVPQAPDFAIALLIVREALHHLPLRRGRWQRSA